MRSIHVITLAVLSINMACNNGPSPDVTDDDDDSSEDNNSVILTDAAVVIEPEQTQPMIVGEDFLVFESANGLEDVSVGNVISGTYDNGGYLRQVTSRSQAADGSIALETEPAQLTDYFEEAVIKVTLTDASAPGRATGDGELNLSASETFTVNFTPEITGVFDVALNAGVEMEIDLRILARRLEKFAYRFSGSVSSEGTLSAEMANAFSEFYSRDFPKLINTGFWIAPYGPWIGIEIQPSAALNVQLESLLTAAVSYEASFSVTTGAVYELGDWTPIRETDQSLVINEPTWDFSGQALLQASLALKARALIFELVGPELTLGPYAKAEAIFTPPECSLEVGAGIDGTFSIDLTVFDRFIDEERRSWEVFDIYRPLYNATEDMLGLCERENISWIQISAGGAHTCALRTDGSIACWGAGRSTGGCNTIGGYECGQSLPPSGTFIQISAGDNHNCGLKTDGAVMCWGADYSDQSSPPAGTFTQVSAGGGHSCAVTTDGIVLCWGSNMQGQSSPPSGTFTQISAGNSHTCGVRSDRTVNCWGWDEYGQSSPPVDTFTQISAGDNHSCAITADGTVACWGNNVAGQSNPPSSIIFNKVAAGGTHTCGVIMDETINCWGLGQHADDCSPLVWECGQSNPPTGTFTQVSTGRHHSCGIRSDGSIDCWGLDSYGQATPPTE